MLKIRCLDASMLPIKSNQNPKQKTKTKNLTKLKIIIWLIVKCIFVNQSKKTTISNYRYKEFLSKINKLTIKNFCFLRKKHHNKNKSIFITAKTVLDFLYWILKFSLLLCVINKKHMQKHPIIIIIIHIIMNPKNIIFVHSVFCLFVYLKTMCVCFYVNKDTDTQKTFYNEQKAIHRHITTNQILFLNKWNKKLFHKKRCSWLYCVCVCVFRCCFFPL